MSDDESPLASHMIRVRLGHGANCSSIGSVVDTLFVVSAVSGALLAAIAAAMTSEPVRVVGGDTPSPPPEPAHDEEAP